MDQATHNLRAGDRAGASGASDPGAAASARAAYDAGGDVSSDRIKRDIDRTRADLDETICALQEKLTPRNLAGELGDALLTGAGTASRRLAGTVRSHPLPAAMIGLGLVWMASERGRKNNYQRPYDGYDVGRGRDDDWLATGAEYFPYPPEQYRGRGGMGGMGMSGRGGATSFGSSARSAAEQAAEYGRLARERASGAVRSVGEGISGAAHRTGSVIGAAGHRIADAGSAARSRVSDAGGYVTGRASDAAHYAREQASYAREQAGYAGEYLRDQAYHVGRRTQEGAEYARDKFWQGYETSPLAVGAGALALGLVAGLVLPSTRREDRLLGHARDEAYDLAREKARDYGQQAMVAGRRLADTAVAAGREAVQEGSDKPVTERVRDAAHRAIEATKDEIRQQTGAGSQQSESAQIAGRDAQGGAGLGQGEGSSTRQGQGQQAQTGTPRM